MNWSSDGIHQELQKIHKNLKKKTADHSHVHQCNMYRAQRVHVHRIIRAPSGSRAILDLRQLAFRLSNKELSSVTV